MRVRSIWCSRGVALEAIARAGDERPSSQLWARRSHHRCPRDEFLEDTGFVIGCRLRDIAVSPEAGLGHSARALCALICTQPVGVSDCKPIAAIRRSSTVRTGGFRRSLDSSFCRRDAPTCAAPRMSSTASMSCCIFVYSKFLDTRTLHTMSPPIFLDEFH